MSLGENVKVNGCLPLCSPLISWQPVLPDPQPMKVGSDY